MAAAVWASSTFGERHRAGALALVMGLAIGGAAGAAVTPEEVWQNWQDSLGAQGQTVTAEATSREGDTLVVSGITLKMTGEGGDSSALIGEIRFRDRGDGSVAILMPDSFPVLFRIPPAPGVEGAVAEELRLNITMPGAETVASGTPEALSYATTAPSVEVTTEIADGGETANVAAKLAEVKATHLVESGAGKSSVTQEFAAQSVDVSLDLSGDPASEGKFTLALSDVGGKAAMVGIPPGGTADMEAALKAGMTMDLSANYGLGSFDLAAKEGGEPFRMTGALGGGKLVMGFGPDHFAYESSSKSVSLNFSGQDTTTAKPMTFALTLADLSSRLAIEGQDWAAGKDFDAAIKQGLKMSGGFGIGPASFDFTGQEEAGETAVKLAMGSMSSNFALEAKALDYDLGAKALTLSVAGPEIPLPEVSLSVTELALDLGMPLQKSETPAPFNMLAKVVDLNMGDDIWAMVDGAGMLPHDPASFVLDMGGTATLMEDLSAEQAVEGAPPAILPNSLDLTQLLLRLAGAEVTGSGGFTFDLNDMNTIPGLPLPTGKIDLRATGVNGLMDKLVAMGLVTEEDATGVRMMVSMFANTDSAKDEMTSVLEFKDGHFYANGQMLQ